MFAFTLVALAALGFAAIALGLDSKAASNLQNAADSAALAGATAFVATDQPRAADRLKEAEIAAKVTAAGNAEYALTDFDVAAVSEDAYGQHTEIEVSLAFQPANVAASVLGRNANVALTRTAAATATWGFPLCVLSLEKSGPGFSTDGSASLTANNCVIWSNSTSQRSMNFSGGDAKAQAFCAVGRAPVTGGTQISPRPTESCDAIPDPLEGMDIPSAPGKPVVAVLTYAATQVTASKVALANMINKAVGDAGLDSAIADLRDALIDGEPLSSPAGTSLAEGVFDALAAGESKWLDENGTFKKGAAKGLNILEIAQILGIIDNLPGDLYGDDHYFSGVTDTLSPGTYAGLDVYKGHVRMLPGVYHIVDAPLIVRRKATLTGEGVTIILHGEKATFSVADRARLTLSAPEEDATAGFALISDPADIPNNKTPRSRLTGSGKVSMIGTVYLPEQNFSITGSGAADQASPLLQIVANAIDMGDSGGLKIEFDPSETDVPMRIKPARQARLIR
ncbi:MAG: hypothetical protein KDA53_17990 [Hyphomonas sp.]|nr:hypothetical protein [Hyphomonas sp.]